MEKRKLDFLKNILNALEVTEVRQVNEKNILLNFTDDIRLYIDATGAGIDFSLEAGTNKGDEIVTEIEAMMGDAQTKEKP